MLYENVEFKWPHEKNVKWKYFLMIQPKKSNEFLCDYLLNQIRMTQAKYTKMTQFKKDIMHSDYLLCYIYRTTQPKKNISCTVATITWPNQRKI